MEVVKKQGEEGIVGFGGVRRTISLSLVEKESDWVLVHAGYAIKVLSEKISSVLNDGDEVS